MSLHDDGLERPQPRAACADVIAFNARDEDALRVRRVDRDSRTLERVVADVGSLLVDT